MKTLAIAMLCHAANAAYCASLGDNTQVPWDQAPDWQKNSAIKGVDFCLQNPDAPPSANHDAWMAQKVAEGWVYGDKKDPDAKPPTHPCIVPFDQLPPAQQFKDVLFKTIVKGCAADAGDDGSSNLHPDFAAAMEAGNNQALSSVTAERDELKAQLVAANARADAAAADANAIKASVTRAETTTAPRKVGPLKNGLSGNDVADAVSKADAAGKKVEIAFSDGKLEIAGVPAVVVTGQVWKSHTLGTMLRDPVTVKGASPDGSSYGIAGYGLLIDGKQLAWCQRSDTVFVAPGQEITLADDIVF